MHTRTAFMGAALLGMAGLLATGGAAIGQNLEHKRAAKAEAARVLEDHGAWASCGAVTVLVIGSNVYGARKAQENIFAACDAASGGAHLPNGGDGLVGSGFRVEAR